MSTDLSDFLRARIAEDEAEIEAGYDFATLDSAGWMGHAAMWGRERALAECDAKRRIVEADAGRRVHNEEASRSHLAFWGDGIVEVNGERMSTAEFDERFTDPAEPSWHVRVLALPYADHPDYRDEWRP